MVCGKLVRRAGRTVRHHCSDSLFVPGRQSGPATFFVRGNSMISSAHARTVANWAATSALALLLGACVSGGSQQAAVAPEPQAPPEIPATIRADEIVGRWGVGSFTNPADRARTEVAAKGACKNPYVISPGSSGGVVMHLADQATPQELRLKGSQSGKNYIGPPGPTPGEQDREIVAFDGRVMITRYVDKDAATRYGNMIYVRCAPHA